MTLTVVDDGPGAWMHALVIGIGGYDHLKDGVGDRLPDPLRYGNLGQLTSPPRSALAVVDALTSDALDWVVPLGTVDLLVSPAPEDPDPAGDGRQFEAATRDAIQVAFDSWWERCKADRNNVAFFYVAGHGLEGKYQIVLPADFGRFPGQPWLQAFNADDTRKALSANGAQTQLFFVDACREVTTSNVEVPDPAATPLRPWTMRQRDKSIYTLAVSATSRNQKAYGEVRQPSYFARALVSGLAGGAGTKSDGEWWITTGKLAERFYTLMELAGADTDAQRPVPIVTRPTRLARLSSAPPAQLQLSCRPDEATALADLAWWQGAASPQTRPQRAAAPWTVDVVPGLCYVSATFVGGEFSSKQQDVVVEPPRTCERVMVR
jgi:hypothetical protein